MSGFGSGSSDEKKIFKEASEWVVKRDRGLTSEEEFEYSYWLSQAPRHQEVMDELSASWMQMEPLDLGESAEEFEVEVEDLVKRRRRSQMRWLLPISGVAAAVLAMVAWPKLTSRTSVPELVVEETFVVDSYENHIFQDGSIIELNGGTKVETRFSETERSIWLLEGEAHFHVAKNPLVPFVVHAGESRFQAIGTAFNVRLTQERVDLLVTEGVVRMTQAEDTDTNGDEDDPAPRSEELEAYERLSLPRSDEASSIRVIDVSPEEMASELSWKPQTLEFTAAPLGDVVLAFNKRNKLQLVLMDPELKSMKIDATFRSDKVETFARLLELTFGIQLERRGKDEIRLYKPN